MIIVMKSYMDKLKVAWKINSKFNHVTLKKYIF